MPASGPLRYQLSTFSAATPSTGYATVTVVSSAPTQIGSSAHFSRQDCLPAEHDNEYECLQCRNMHQNVKRMLASHVQTASNHDEVGWCRTDGDDAGCLTSLLSPSPPPLPTAPNAVHQAAGGRGEPLLRGGQLLWTQSLPRGGS